MHHRQRLARVQVEERRRQPAREAHRVLVRDRRPLLVVLHQQLLEAALLAPLGEEGVGVARNVRNRSQEPADVRLRKKEVGVVSQGLCSLRWAGVSAACGGRRDGAERTW